MSGKLERRLAMLALAVFLIVMGVGYKIRMDQINERNAKMAAEAERLRAEQAQAEKERAAKLATQEAEKERELEELLESVNHSYTLPAVTENKTDDDSQKTVVTDKEKGIEVVTSDKDVSDKAAVIVTTEPVAPLAAVSSVPVDANTGGLPESFYESKEEAAKAIEKIPAGDTVAIELPKADGTTANIDFAKVTQVAYYPLEYDEMADEWLPANTPVYYTVEEAKNNPIDGMVINMGEIETDEYGEKFSVTYTYDKFAGKWIRQSQYDLFFREPYIRYNPETQRHEWIAENGEWGWTDKATLAARNDIILGVGLTPEEKEFWGDTFEGWGLGGGDE
ncbi:hypothetical protein [Bacteroides heparinolyticus]|uniref:hypothetical protein n=1 Tax=Prevotella heparinolytica TaxID=28113 RepID=UPI0035A1585A